MVKPVVQHTMQVRRALLTASAVTMAMLVVLLVVTIASCTKRTPDDKTVHQGLTQPMTTSSPDNCSGCWGGI